jgi:hypothetical protein
MTFKKEKKGFWIFKSIKYSVLMADKNEYFIISSKNELSATDLDIIFSQVIKLGIPVGNFKTEKGIIKFKTNSLSWLKEKDEFKTSKKVEERSQETNR